MLRVVVRGLELSANVVEVRTFLGLETEGRILLHLLVLHQMICLTDKRYFFRS
jgi:hypothetical protein